MSLALARLISLGNISLDLQKISLALVSTYCRSLHLARAFARRSTLHIHTTDLYRYTLTELMLKLYSKQYSLSAYNSTIGQDNKTHNLVCIMVTRLLPVTSFSVNNLMLIV